VTGRRTFDLTHGWGGRHPLDVPVFVVTHKASPEWVSEGSPFTFVSDGLESAVAQAKAAAGDKDVGVIGANLVQQCIRGGLLDEMHLDMVPVVLGGGVELFDHLGTGPIQLESTRVIEGAGVTHRAESGVEIANELSHTPAAGRCGGQAAEHRGDRCWCVMTRPFKGRNLTSPHLTSPHPPAPRY
jgi:dihydrofolate reductase